MTQSNIAGNAEKKARQVADDTCAEHTVSNAMRRHSSSAQWSSCVMQVATNGDMSIERPVVTKSQLRMQTPELSLPERERLARAQ